MANGREREREEGIPNGIDHYKSMSKISIFQTQNKTPVHEKGQIQWAAQALDGSGFLLYSSVVA
jgi:hypothetical protein